MRKLLNANKSKTNLEAQLEAQSDEQLEAQLDALQHKMVSAVRRQSRTADTGLSTVDTTAADTTAADTVIEEEERNSIENLFGDIFKNLTREVYKIIGDRESYSSNPPGKSPGKSPPRKSEQVDIDNFSNLNTILETLAEIIIDDNKEKQLLYKRPKEGSSTHTIKLVSLGMEITYTTLEEFLNKIAAKARAAKTLCFFCAAEIHTAIDNYSNKHKYSKKITTSEEKKIEYNELFELFTPLDI